MNVIYSFLLTILKQLEKIISMLLIVNTAAESGGALTILENHYKDALKMNQKVVFIIGKPRFKNVKNIQVINYPWTKKSWFHRLYFDFFTLPSLILKLNPKRIISLQNLSVRLIKFIPQTIFVHQVIPFSDYKFGLFDFKMLFYKYIYRIFLFKSIKQADMVLVQTQFMKEQILKFKLKNSSKIKVVTNNVERASYSYIGNNLNFFYPATPTKYKNHLIIIKALKYLKMNKDDLNIKVFFTLTGYENKYSNFLLNQCKKASLNVEFLGLLSKDKIQYYYKTCTLIFPSLLESLGLPLIEARNSFSPIIAIDKPYCKEVLLGYKRVIFFEDNNFVKLANNIKFISKGFLI